MTKYEWTATAAVFLPFLAVVLVLVAVEFVSDRRPKVRWNLRRAIGLVAQFVVDYPSMWRENCRDSIGRSESR